MRFSLRFLLPGTIVTFLFIGGLFLAIFSTYTFYQRQVNSVIQERITDLRVIQNIFYNPIMYYRGLSFWPEMRPILIKETAKAANVVFLRIVQPATGIILVSNLEEEMGKTAQEPPPFPADQPFIRQGKWKGEETIELSIRGIATENLWMGITLKPIREKVLGLAVIEGTSVFLVVMLVGAILYFVIRKILLNPVMIIYEGMEQVRKGNLDVKIDVKSKTEIGELAARFNETVRALKQSRAMLEETKTVLEIKVVAKTKELKELTEGLEEQVKEKTKELQGKIEELERFQKLTIGRELKMLELKKEIEILEKEQKITRK